MDELKMERTIRETMKTTAEGLKAPDQLKTRIDFALRSGETQAPARRRPRWGKKLAAVCLVAALAVTGAVAGSGVVGWYSSTMLNQNWTNFGKTAEYVQEHVPSAKYVEAFPNGYTLDRGYENTTDKKHESGNTLGSFTSVMMDYEKDGTELTFEVEPVQEEGEYTSPYDTVRTVADTEVHYREMKGITLPPDGSIQPTAEEQAAVEAGDLQIGYGSSSVETHDAQFLRWTQDGVTYTMHGFDLGLTADELFAMAQEVIEA